MASQAQQIEVGGRTEPGAGDGTGSNALRLIRVIRTGTAAAGGLIRSAPFTTGLLVVMLAVAAATGSLAGHAPIDQLGYGLPALQDGRWWNLAVGAAILPDPVMYLAMTPLIVLAVGYYERQVGGFRAAGVLLAAHLVGTVGVALALGLLAGPAWPWAQLVAGQTDLGMSAGTVGVLAAATAVMTPRVRRAVRTVGSAYLAVMLLRSGLLWDAEHLLGWGFGLAIGPLAAGRQVRRGAVTLPRIRQVRAAAALALAVLAAARLVTAAYPGNGGVFGAGQQGAPAGAGTLAAALIFGAVALTIANALRRGLPLAWWAALACSALSAGHAAHSLGRPSADVLLWGLLAAGLIAGRGYWPWRLPTAALRRTLPRLLIAGGAFLALSTVLLWILRPQLTDAGALQPRQIAARAVFSDGGVMAGTGVAHTVLMIASWVWAIALVALLVPLLYASHVPGHRDRRRAARGGRSDRGSVADRRLVSLIRRHGGGNLGWQRTWPGFTEWYASTGDVAVSYRVVSGVAIAIGDPVGPRHRWSAAAQEFQRFCLRSGWTACWYAASEEFLALAGQGWQHTRIGDDAVIDLCGLAFTGKSWQDVRTARNRAEREGIRFEIVDTAATSVELLAAIQQVSTAWADGKPLPEMGFTLGTAEIARDGVMRTHVAIDDDGVVHGVTTWMPVHADGRLVGWTLDVMRRRCDGFRPVMEFLIAESLLAFQTEGCEFASLSVAPLARPAGDPGAEPLGRLERTLDRLGEMLEPAYGFRSLMSYKTKFKPRFTPVYLGYASPVDLPDIAVAIGRAYLPDLTPTQALSIAKVLRPGRSRARTGAVDNRGADHMPAVRELSPAA